MTKAIPLSLALSLLFIGCAKQEYVYTEIKPTNTMMQEIGGSYYVEDYYRGTPIGNIKNHHSQRDVHNGEIAVNEERSTKERIISYGELEDRYIVVDNIAYPRSKDYKTDVPDEPMEYSENDNKEHAGMDWHDESRNISGPKIVRRQYEGKAKRIPFPQSEYSQIPAKGNGSIRGNVLFRSDNGTEIPINGAKLYLNPVTSYSKQWYKETYLKGRTMEKADDRIYNYIKYTSSSKNGVYAFYELPRGTYYLTGIAKCGKRCGFGKNRTLNFFSEIYVDGSSEKEKDILSYIR